MEEWKECKLGDIAHFTTGKLNSNAAEDNGIYPFFTCSPETYRINSYAFDTNAILLAGNNAEGNFNIKRYSGKFNAYQRTYVITVDDYTDLTFLFYALKLCLAEFKHISQGTATKFLTTKILNNFVINLPPLPTQQKIATILSSLDDKIELNNKINNNLEQQAQAIFKSWFVDFEPFGGEMPETWRIGKLSEIADYLNGLAMQKFRPIENEIGLPVLKIKELRQGSCDENSELCSPTSIKKEFIIHDGDVIFSWSGSLLVDIWCGGKCGLNQHLFKVTSKQYDKWFYYLWTKHHLDRFIFLAADKATTMGHIKREELDKAEVVIPSEIDMKRISSVMQPIIDMIINNKIENIRLSKTRDELLPKLMNGDLSVDEVRI